MASRVTFTAKQQVALHEFTPPKVKRGEIGVKALYSLMSIGTENICFNRLFAAGTPWDEWVQYPFYPGYAFIGEVDEVGPGVRNFKPGDKVALRKEHWSYHVVPAATAFKMPKGVDLKESVWFALAKIAFMGAKAAPYRLGDRALVIGAGPIGQMSLRWIAAAGAESLTVVDMMPKRLKLAIRGGATHVIGKPIDQCRDEILEASGGHLPDLVVDSTGNEVVFATALGLAADYGRVVIVGDTGFAAKQHLTGDVIQKGLKVVGAHDRHVTVEWPEHRPYRLFLSLVKAGRFNIKGLNTHTFTPDECVKAYDVANTRRQDTMGIVFDWTKM